MNNIIISTQPSNVCVTNYQSSQMYWHGKNEPSFLDWILTRHASLSRLPSPAQRLLSKTRPGANREYRFLHSSRLHTGISTFRKISTVVPNLYFRPQPVTIIFRFSKESVVASGRQIGLIRSVKLTGLSNLIKAMSLC